MTSESVLQLEAVHKSFGTVRAVDGISLDVPRGEIMTLLGPSGCGKSTTLRLMVGLEQCDQGRVIYEGRVLDDPRQRVFMPPHKRKMGMVFQSYAIWPHMTVFENVAYPLRVRGTKGEALQKAVLHALELVGLNGLENRPATHLSGGQQQRVAVARSLVFEPAILLLDEPFSNLDAKLREQMRVELKLLQQRLGITVVFVTHDQTEALSLSDRIAVMDQGHIEQTGSPQELYTRPATQQVRDFLGKVILLRGQVKEKRLEAGVLVELPDKSRLLCTAPSPPVAVGTPCRVAIRPEQVEVAASTGYADANALSGVIETLLFLGDRYEAQVRMNFGDTVLTYLPSSQRWDQGQAVLLKLPPDKLQVWPS